MEHNIADLLEEVGTNNNISANMENIVIITEKPRPSNQGDRPYGAYGWIYVIRNTVNGKLYVGQTIHKVEHRWYQHVQKSQYNTKKHNTNTCISGAINKYGADSFSVDIIAAGNSLEDLNEKEIFWISQLNTIAPNGYNIKTGGKNGKLSEESKRKLSESLKETFKDASIRKKISDARKGFVPTAEQIENSRQGILKYYQDQANRDACKARAESRWENPEYRAMMLKSIAEYAASEEAKEKRKLRTEKKRLEKELSGYKRKPHKKRPKKGPNLTALEAKKQKFIRMNKERCLTEPFEVFDLNGNLLGTFTDKRECAKFLGVRGTGQITNWLKGKYVSRKYVLKYIEQNGVNNDSV